MSIYSDYLKSIRDFDQVTVERKKILKEISELRGNRDILVIAADISKNDSRIQIDYTDILPVDDLVKSMKGSQIDIILETPGGLAEVAEDIVNIIRKKYEKVGMIIPGYAKSAGTIFAMAGDEILMGETSALGPIDAQIQFQGKRFSADAFLEGLRKIKDEVQKEGKLNVAYVPILQNISPGEIQHCENAQDLSKGLVTQWLERYKFKYWDKHSSTGLQVTENDRHVRAEEIAMELRSQSKWLTHNRSIKLKDLEDLRIKVTDYTKDEKLNDLIRKYYTLLRMTFEATNIYKIFETTDLQIYRFLGIAKNVPSSPIPPNVESATFETQCLKCHKMFKIQANLRRNVPLEKGALPYPIDNNVLKCSDCGTENNLMNIRMQLEAQSGRKFVP